MPRPLVPYRRMGRLQRPGCDIHYEATGSGPPIVFLHGLGGNQLSWWQQVAHFAPTHTCVTFAARGFAPSSPLKGGPNPRDFAGDIEALVAHLQLDRVALVAQSMGGWGAVEYALGHPAKVRALVLAATTGTIDIAGIAEPERSRLADWHARSQAMMHEWAQQRIHVACGARMAAEQPGLHLLYKHIDDMNAALDKNALRERLGRARVRPPSDLEGVGCPVLFISGDEDMVIPPFAADAIARVVPGAGVCHIADAGHSAYFERAAQFNALLEQVLQQTT